MFHAAITELLTLQGQLDQSVLDNLPDDKQSTDFRTERAIAMVCEYLEGADGSLEEQADFLHFILSYALEWGLGADDLMHPAMDTGTPYVPRTQEEVRTSTMLALSQMLNLHERDWKFWKRRHRFATYEQVAVICRTLLWDCVEANLHSGRYFDALVAAYKEKNAENHARQKSGY